jgi:hypothetical protein
MLYELYVTKVVILKSNGKSTMGFQELSLRFKWIMGGIGQGKETKILNVVDVLTVQKWIQKS